jgi:hypothetical protein
MNGIDQRKICGTIPDNLLSKVLDMYEEKGEIQLFS